MKQELVSALIKSFFSSEDWIRKLDDTGVSYFYENKVLNIDIHCFWLFNYKIDFEDPKYSVRIFPNHGWKLWLAFRMLKKETPLEKRQEFKMMECIKKLEI